MKKLLVALMAVLFLGSTTGMVMAQATTGSPKTVKTHKKGHKGGKKGSKGMEKGAAPAAAPATTK